MAGNMTDYLKEYGDISLAEKPLNDVDSLILCQLAYLKYDGMVCDVRENGPFVSIKELAKHPAFDKLFADERYEKVNRELFQAVIGSRRLCNTRLNCYINLIEKEWETQFSAVTFLLEDGTLYIAFRGTDETIVGWKEDFNMAFLSPIPGQSYSVKYLNMVTKYFRRPFYVGGHSKGGNLAVYSAMKCIPDARKRIVKVYSMDGPGFRPEVLEGCGYDKIEECVVKILPHSSIVGMIFESGTNMKVVESNRYGLAQHDPFTWLVENGEFVLAEDISESRRFMDSTINEWILSLEEEKLRTFVDTMYQVVSASQAENLIEFAANRKNCMNAIMGAIREMDEESAQMIKEIVHSLFEAVGKRMRERVKYSQVIKRGKILSKRTEVQAELPLES